MKTLENNSFSLKRNYIIPTIECVKLDNQISLQLDSLAPPLPDEPNCVYNAPNFITNDPFRNNVG